MYKVCQSDESLARQRALEKALMVAMRKKRFESISVNSLCEATGVSRNTFYRYFPTKEDALLALIDHMLMASSEASVRSPAGNGRYGDLLSVLAGKAGLSGYPQLQ